MRLSLLLLLACDTGIQAGKAPPAIGEPCDGGRCGTDAVCNHEGTCAVPGELGTTEAGGDCSATPECAWELECSGGNVCAPAGSEGTGSDGESCTTDNDCQAGFLCGDDGTCKDLEIPFWEGGPCPADAGDDEEFRVLFQVPDLPTSSPLDFFSMPFPNDLRLGTDGKLVLDGFPGPGEDAPTVNTLLSLVETQSGWPLDPVVIFRFNKPHDLETIKVLTTDATVHFASIDEDADDYGELPALEYFTRKTRNRYVCQNWLAVTTYPGRPLLPNQHYAVWLTKGITTEDGAEVFRDDDFPMLMQDDRPTDLTDARAFDQFAPFREYVDAQGLTRGEIVAATVFTTGDPLREGRYFREVIETETTEVVVDSVASCSDSPCGLPCSSGSGFTEEHALISIPDFTKSTGAVEWSSSFRPVVQNSLSVCAVLTKPEGTAPTAGWPTALWLGDLGGTASDAANNGAAAAFAAEGVATLSIDLPGHGQREGGDPLAAWFPTTDPAAWRGGLVQLLADALSLHHLTEDPLLGLDASNVWVVGEGVGADAGVLALAFGKDLRGGVLGNASGMSAQLASERLLPFDVAHALQRDFADSNLSRYHPLIGLLESWLAVTDPVLSAEGVVREPETIAKNVVFVHGVDDEEVPGDNLRAVLRAASLPTAGQVLDDFEQATIEYPVFENVTTPDGKRTAAVVQIAGGHHALSEQALEQAAAFVGSGADGDTPKLQK